MGIESEMVYGGQYDDVKCPICGVPWNDELTGEKHSPECSRHAYRPGAPDVGSKGALAGHLIEAARPGMSAASEAEALAEIVRTSGYLHREPGLAAPPKMSPIGDKTGTESTSSLPASLAAIDAHD